VLDGLVEIVVPGADDAEVDVGYRAAHGRIGCPVGPGVVGDEFAGVFFGGLVVAEPGVAGSGVEDPFRVVEHEVVLGVFAPRSTRPRPRSSCWPYDLRHAGISSRLNAGVPGPQVAEWAGHSVEVLYRTYAHCIDGDDGRWHKQMEDFLG
jgi:hypothetical protein